MWKRKAIIVAVFIGLVAFAAPGCVVHHESATATLDIGWDFEGRDCGRAGVAETLVKVYDGATLVDSVYVQCPANSVLFDVVPGWYGFHIEGIGHDDEVLYAADSASDFHAISGDNVVDVSLPYVGRY